MSIITAPAVLAHIKSVRPGIDKTRAVLLVHYAQAWALAWRGEPLFDESVEAWEHGPAVPAAHHAFSTTLPRRIRLTGPDAEDQRREIEAVVAHYGDMTASALVALAKSESPWAEAAAAGVPAFASGPEIPLAAIRDFHAARITDADSPQRPGPEAAAAEEEKRRARALREQLTARFETGLPLRPTSPGDPGASGASDPHGASAARSRSEAPGPPEPSGESGAHSWVIHRPDQG